MLFGNFERSSHFTFCFHAHDCIIWRCLFILSFHWNWVLNCFSVTWYTLISRNCKVATMSFNITIFIITIILRTICNKKNLKPKCYNMYWRWCVCWLKISQKGEYFQLILSFLDYKQTLSRDSTNRVCFLYFFPIMTRYRLLNTIYLCVVLTCRQGCH